MTPTGSRRLEGHGSRSTQLWPNIWVGCPPQTVSSVGSTQVEGSWRNPFGGRMGSQSNAHRSPKTRLLTGGWCASLLAAGSCSRRSSGIVWIGTVSLDSLKSRHRVTSLSTDPRGCNRQAHGRRIRQHYGRRDRGGGVRTGPAQPWWLWWPRAEKIVADTDEGFRGKQLRGVALGQRRRLGGPLDRACTDLAAAHVQQMCGAVEFGDEVDEARIVVVEHPAAQASASAAVSCRSCGLPLGNRAVEDGSEGTMPGRGACLFPV
jgi:hypothetical protein